MTLRSTLITCLLVSICALLLGTGCLALRPAPADPNAMNQPVFEPLARGDFVTIEAISVNGQTAPGKSLESAIDNVREYFAGELRLAEGKPVEVDLGDDGALSMKQFESILAGAKNSGPFSIVVVIAPDLEFSDYPAVYSFGLSSNTAREKLGDTTPHRISVNAREFDRRVPTIPLFFSARDGWEHMITHELCHALGVPSDKSHAWMNGHCTRPGCVIYNRSDKRSWAWDVLHLGPPNKLCNECEREIRAVQSAAKEQLLDHEQSYDLARWAKPIYLNGLSWILATSSNDKIRNGERAVELATRACELTEWENDGFLDTLASAYAEAGDFDSAIEYQTKALKLAEEKNTEEYRKRLKLFRGRKPYREFKR